MKQILTLTLIVFLLDSCKKKDKELPEVVLPKVLEKTMHYYGRDGLVYHYYSYDSNNRLIKMEYRDATLGSSPERLFRSFVRNNAGMITHMTSLTVESQPDTLESVISYLSPTGNIDHVVAVGKSKKDSSDYVYSGSTIYVDKHNWSAVSQQYTFVHRTSYELKDGNVASIKRVQPGNAYNTWTKTYTYDEMLFPIPMTTNELILANWFESPLVNNFEGSVSGGKKTMLFQFSDGAGNPRTKTEQFLHTYRNDKRPVRTDVIWDTKDWGHILYFYK